MVEVVLVAVEVADGYRYVPSAVRVLLGKGVQYPFVCRCRDAHRSRLTQEVNVELCRCSSVLGIRWRHDTDGQSLIVEPVAGAHLQLQFCGLARHNAYGHAASGQRLSVDTKLGSVGVCIVSGKQVIDTHATGGFRLLALVGNIDGEACRVVDRYAADAVLVEADGWVVNLQRALVKDRTSLVEVRRALVLPRGGGVTAARAVYEAARSAEVGSIGLILQHSNSVCRQAFKIVSAEDIFGADFFY